MLKIFTFVACLFLSACFMVGPNYKEPKKPVAVHWPKKDATVKEAPFKTTKWWQVFHDPILTSLIYQGYHNNLTVQSAGVRVLQTRALLAQSVGQLYPQQQAVTGNFTYVELGGSELQSILPSSFSTLSLGFAANWEIDFWGKYRRAIQANDATFLSSLAAYDNALVTLTADVASTYIQVRTFEAQIKVTKANIVVQKEGLKIAKARYNAGETNLMDVEQAQTELSQTEASLPPLENSLEQQKNALALLLGTVPNGVDGELKKGKGIPKAPSSVAVGIPIETLARRPDIHQARLEAIAQSAKIGATKANLFPSLALNGTFVFSSNNIGQNSLADLFQWSNRSITTGPALTWPILNYGQITNAVRAQDAVFQQSLLNYVNLVLKAQQEVQNSITAYIEAKKAERALTQANNSAIKSLKLAIIRYINGEVDFTPVLNAEQQQLSVQTSLVNAQANIPQALVSLYRALGGGWEIRGANDVVPEQIKAEMAARTNWGTLLKQQNHELPRTKKERVKELYLPKW
ncbi:efflux transporter outer membrane subunit [Legionella tucsonensis]|uniref:Outer membrane efflux protein n=1 Tax=Legionella tucsonensis TaxID=40335 RepID=A0A0W0ZTC2_9GAMM|nr:efflux transporter outer membrane subunit [Legionella tucsonensis]KTD72433.1 outer membrane efflux protein [Legionella tucsonensis]